MTLVDQVLKWITAILGVVVMIVEIAMFFIV